jgi:UDP-3-O-[3-hydroxymyristoyl] N-acetylglucosamine deacetylase / 3-hydroxyacyl-[acyl-carrier-protein] dehydratase
MAQEKQRTIQTKSSFTGTGLHTGNESKITFCPAPIGHGYSFVRTDQEPNVEIPALVDYVVDLSRGTTLGIGDTKVHTVEHVLAALVGLQIDNCRIELTANEPPVGDGSSMPYVNALLEAGVEEQDGRREYFVLPEMIRYQNDEKEVDLVALPNQDYRLTVMVDYENPALGSQHTGLFDFEGEFAREFAPARTFCFLTELQMLNRNGLIKGGSLESGIVIVDKDASKEELEEIKNIFDLDKTPSFGKSGILNDVALRFKNEPARHKLLDIIGDLTLAGVPLKGQILAARPGHASNIELAKLIREKYLEHKAKEKYNPNKSSNIELDINEIMEILPHRYPFLLLDKVMSYDEDEKIIIACKNVTINEPFFPGHFPGKPIMPGMLILEAMAQVGGIMIALTQGKEKTKGKKAFFMSVSNAKFRVPVIPGDQLILEVKLAQKRFNVFKFEAKAFVAGKLVTESEFQAALVEG